jgi:hypothetical protein
MVEEARTGYDRRPMLLCALAVVAMLAIGAVDFAITSERVPEAPLPGASSTAFEDRIERAIELSDDFAVRAWAYAAAAFTAALIAAVVGLRRNPRSRHRDVFTDLGVGAVLWLIAGVAIGIFDPDDLIDVPTQQLFYPAIGLAVVAGIGTLVTRRPPPGEAEEGDPTAGPAVRWIGYSATILGVAFAVIGASGRPDPCALGASEQGVDSLVGWSVLLAGISIVCGIASLLQRRWVGALIMLGAAPFAALVALFTGACWN